MEKIRHMGLVPAVRAPSADLARRAVSALVEGGIAVIEIPVTVPAAYALIAEIRNLHENDIVMGAGTVLDTEAASRAIQAGAQFIVSPCLNLEVIAFCKRQEIAVIPGAFTPTEIVTAWRAGVDCIKVFPVSAAGGVKYIRSLRVPLPEVPLLPMGGVTIEDASAYLRAGAVAVGVGSDLVDVAALAQNRDDVLIQRAREYVARIREAQVGAFIPSSANHANQQQETTG